MEGSETSRWIEGYIREAVASRDNTLGLEPHEPAWGAPLVGFSRGDDPLYGFFKEDIGPFYWTPEEAFRLAFPQIKAPPQDLTVISWVLPQTERTRLENRAEGVFPSQRWARARKYGEEFNVRLRGKLAAALRLAGHEAVAPMNLPQWRRDTSSRHGIASCWSERHAAYVAGLGTFGLCDGLITPLGKAVRLGSVVARLVIPPTERPYAERHAYCLFYRDGGCGVCIRRCPAGAITREGHDKERCGAYTHSVVSRHVRKAYGLEIDSCGLCQTAVPCEDAIPLPLRPHPHQGRP